MNIAPDSTNPHQKATPLRHSPAVEGVTEDVSGDVPVPDAGLLAVRQWAFEKALACKTDMDIISDIIYKAAEIEAYVTKGKNPRGEFICCVDVALAEVDHAGIPNVGNDKKRLVMAEVRKWLKEYDIL